MIDLLHTERLTLRRPAGGDWPALRAFHMSDRASYVGGPRDLGAAWRIFAAEVGHWDIFGFGMWAVTVTGDDAAIGLIGPWSPPDWPENEIGWFVFGGAEGKGYAAEAARAALTHAFDTLGWDTAVSYIAPGNARSIALAERLGAVLDPDAALPPGEPCLVYRHTPPKVRP